MKILWTIALFFLAIITCHAQITFKSGYVITNDYQRIECLIKDVGWKNNPTELQYRLTENGEVITAAIDDVKSFGIEDHTRYERFTVDIDRSSINMFHQSTQRDPEYLRETLFLRLLVKGEMSLYYYEDGDLIRFFLRQPDQHPQQLIYKTYLLPNNKLGENTSFRGQLQETISCVDQTGEFTDFNELNYTKKEMLRAFSFYYQCTGKLNAIYTSSRDKISLKVNIRPGLSLSSLTFERDEINPVKSDFGPGLAYRFGAEIEVVLPYQQRKWSVVVEPVFHSYQDNDNRDSGGDYVDYNSIELSAAIRHYFYLPNDHSFFINGGIIADFPFSSAFVGVNNGGIFSGNFIDFKIAPTPNFLIGAGFKFKDRLIAEVRYDTRRNIRNADIYNLGFYRKFLSLVIGYSIF